MSYYRRHNIDCENVYPGSRQSLQQQMHRLDLNQQAPHSYYSPAPPNPYQPYVIPYQHTYHYFPKSEILQASINQPYYSTKIHPSSLGSQTANINNTTSSGQPFTGVMSNSSVHNSLPPYQSNITRLPGYQEETQEIKQSYPNQAPHSTKLIWVLFMHRHGDRTPINMAPRDPYNNISYWPEGFGNLNNAGRLRMYNLGKYIRRRYKDFLSDNMREIYTRSSDVDRCIESAQAVLAGIYPPTETNNWNTHLLWTPAPVHTVPVQDDYLLNEAGRKYMQNYIKEIQIIQQSDEVRQLYRDSITERELLEREYGYDFDMFTKFKCTYSTLDIEERNDLDMPPWYTPQLKEKLYRFSGLAFKLAGSGTENLKRIRSGHLLEDIIYRMDRATIEGPRVEEHNEYVPSSSPTSGMYDKKVVQFSTHDSIIAIFLEALGINEPTPIPPGFGATIFAELYVDLDEHGSIMGEKYIRFFYMDDTTMEKPIEKRLPPSCEVNEKGQVTVSSFRKYVAHLLPHHNLATVNVPNVNSLSNCFAGLSVLSQPYQNR